MHDKSYKKFRVKYHCILAISILLTSHIANCLPIGFFKNQSYLEYQEIKNDTFHLYFDKRSTREAQIALKTLNQAKIIFEKWFNEKTDAPLPVIMSTETANASFANLITNALEIQTRGRGAPSLYVHEFTHHMMYRYFDFLGPSQITYHTAFLPNWWIEGLAETLSVSVSSADQSTLERIKSYTGKWPTYNSLHSLYGGGAQSYNGYVVSGGFTRYLFSRIKDPSLHEIHTNLRGKSLNPLMLVPFIKGTFDRTLEDFGLPEGHELYKQYKKDAKNNWKKLGFKNLEFHSNHKSFDGFLRNSAYIAPQKPEIKIYNNKLWLQKSVRNYSKKSWAKNDNLQRIKTDQIITEALRSKTISSGTKVLFYISGEQNIKGKKTNIIRKWSRKKQKFINYIKRSATIVDLYLVNDEIHWIENKGDKTAACFKKNGSKTKCYAVWGQPDMVNVLTHIQKNNQNKLLIAKKTLTLKGDKFQLQWLNLLNKKTQNISLNDGATITRASILNDSIYAIAKEHNHYSIRQYRKSGQCMRKWKLSDLPVSILAEPSFLKVSFTDGYQNGLKRYSYSSIPWESCTKIRPQQSLYLAATRNPGISFKKALNISNPWKPDNSNIALSESKKLYNTPAFSVKRLKPKSISNRFRHVTTVPWLIQDPFGLAVGVLSAPLMDEMQNHEFRLTAFYGLSSKYASYNLQYINRRFWPTITASTYRELRYNGFLVFANQDGSGNSAFVSYMDEIGGDINFSYPLYTLGIQANLNIKSIYVSNFLNQDLSPFLRQGLLTTGSFNVSKNWRWSKFSVGLSVGGTTAPDYINNKFEYNQIRSGISLGLALPFKSSLSLGVSGSRTRGTKTRNLKELYRPLITFVPGEGAGANQFHFNAADYATAIPRGSLFGARTGENQARSKADFNLPIIRPVDQVWGIAYVSRLDFSAFVNYGGAWNGDTLPKNENLLLAHGYGLDLQLDIKGLNLNAGIGFGQVIGSPFDYYAQLGFDQFF